MKTTALFIGSSLVGLLAYLWVQHLLGAAMGWYDAIETISTTAPLLLPDAAFLIPLMVLLRRKKRTKAQVGVFALVGFVSAVIPTLVALIVLSGSLSSISRAEPGWPPLRHALQSGLLALFFALYAVTGAVFGAATALAAHRQE